MKLSDAQFRGILGDFKKSHVEKQNIIPQDFASDTMLRIRREQARTEESDQSNPLLLLWQAALGSSALSAVAAILVLQISNSLENSIVDLVISQGM
jgi:integral membrane sensor domain MASE1